MLRCDILKNGLRIGCLLAIAEGKLDIAGLTVCGMVLMHVLRQIKLLNNSHELEERTL